MAQADAKYAFSLTVGGSEQAGRDSLFGGGPLAVQPQHWLAKVLPEWYVAGEVTMHLTEFIILGAMLPDATKGRDLAWVIRPARLTRFLEAADAAGALSWDQCATSSETPNRNT
jgi:hypothetical protein